jgi:hypothetical protein
LQQEFEAAGVEIPEEIERLSATVMLSTHVKQVSLSRQFSVDEVTDMAKAAAAKFGNILSFETRYWPCTAAAHWRWSWHGLASSGEGNEAKAKRACQQKVYQHHLDMEILEAEFQWAAGTMWLCDHFTGERHSTLERCSLVRRSYICIILAKPFIPTLGSLRLEKTSQTPIAQSSSSASSFASALRTSCQQYLSACLGHPTTSLISLVLAQQGARLLESIRLQALHPSDRPFLKIRD